MLCITFRVTMGGGVGGACCGGAATGTWAKEAPSDIARQVRAVAMFGEVLNENQYPFKIGTHQVAVWRGFAFRRQRCSQFADEIIHSPVR